MSSAISFDHVSKDYRGARSYQAFRDDVMAVARRAVGGPARQRQPVAALQDVSFEVPEGTSTAIIGANGAGKTTALKIMTRITYPTNGTVRVRGRVGALIEVGTGMHPELSGRENVELHGRILGLSGRDIQRRFDEIVDFAGVGAAIDQPVKQYSSGMQLRIGFSVAAHLEPDVLLVDEAIAVGDAGFQYRCVERMAELVREGRTLVFVSHDMSAIETLCDRAILLRDGRIAEDGPARDVIRNYLVSVQEELVAEEHVTPRLVGDGMEFTRVTLHDQTGRETSTVASDGPFTVRIHYRAHRPIRMPFFTVGLSDARIGLFSMASMLIDGQTPDEVSGEGVVDCVFSELPLHPQLYEVWGSVRGEAGTGDLLDWQRLRRFRVIGDLGTGKGSVAHSLGNAPVKIPYAWKLSAGPSELHAPDPEAVTE